MHVWAHARIGQESRWVACSLHASKANRDAVLESGMESGLRVALDLLDQLAASLR